MVRTYGQCLEGTRVFRQDIGPKVTVSSFYAKNLDTLCLNHIVEKNSIVQKKYTIYSCLVVALALQ